MRIKVTFMGPKGFFVPFNYNHVLASIIYNKIDDEIFSRSLHDSGSYKFFTFSNLIFDNLRNGIVSDGSFSVLISSHDKYFLKSLISGICDDFKVYFQDTLLEVVDVDIIPNPNFDGEACFRSLSPVLSRTLRKIDGEIKTYDLSPSDEFLRNLEFNLINKYLTFYDLDETDKDVSISLLGDDFISKRISIKNGNGMTYNRAFLVNLDIKGNNELIDFAYDVGMGEKNSMGFGMVEKI